ncbi:MAG: helix-turn-helix transcriptional regulator [Pseudomonadota bacterium]
MLSHEQIWTAIDRLANSFGYSPSGLAKQSGLDPTSFNKSKRFGPDGKPRWPSTESLSRVLAATGANMTDFIALVDQDEDHVKKSIPVIGFAQAGAAGFFDEQGYPMGDSWDEVEFPEYQAKEKGVYALKINDDSMEPLYRKNDVLIVSPKSPLRKGDRIIVKTCNGEVMVKELIKQASNKIEVKSLNPAHEDRSFQMRELSWIARVMWVSQ